MKLLRTLAAVSAALLAGSMLLSGPTLAQPGGGKDTWQPALLSIEPLYGGSAQKMHYTEGITVVAPTGATVVFTGSGAVATLPDGRRVYDRSVQILDPHALSRASSAKQAATYQAAGRSVYKDAIAAGFSPEQARRQAQPQGTLDEPPIASSGCAYSEDVQPDPKFEWSGCYKLYAETASDPRAWYAAGSGTGHGWGTGVLGGGKELQKGYTQISWSGASAEIIEASPAANLPGNDCHNVGINLAYIIEVSYQAPLCDDGWSVTWDRTLHKVEWHGSSTRGSSDQRSASGASTVKLPFSTPSVTLNYRIGWTYACYC
ncbi:hypothetical protein AB0368_28105 [Actinoplanes sp. NPDC051475]|uniref:hypothetical protein n=1 Tax=Actinoplanes sp. NPDC051475 TaxID=3157225 RepID=UPI00344C3932